MLDKYNQKRNFDKTKEPKGQINKLSKKKNSCSLIFVVQHHFASREHFDFRLEYKGALLSWAVPKGPSYDTKDKRLAVHVEDHPLDYADFEGTIPKGQYGGGKVYIWDKGTYEAAVDFKKGLEDGNLKFILHGNKLKGRWVLVRTNQYKNKQDNWLLIKEKDDLSGSKNPFDKTDVQLCKPDKSIPAGKDWIFELKYDGYRIVAFIESNKVRLLTRNGNDYSKKFYTIADSLIRFARGRAMVLDGEVVVADKNGRTNFQALQNYIKHKEDKKLSFVIFDLLALDGEDLRQLPLIKRKEKLKELLSSVPGNLQYSEHSENITNKNFQAVCDGKFEGLVAKKINSIYSGTRNGDWIKLKCENIQEFYIGGYTLTDKKTEGLSAILLGYYEESELIYCGRAGTGFTEKGAVELQRKFDKIQQKKSPFGNIVKVAKNETVTWLKPEYIGEIRFAEWTDDNLLRHASFKGIREDIMKIGEEKNKKHGITITSPDKIVYKNPKITKREVGAYYQTVAERMLPYITNRLLSLINCPQGVASPCFFKKHLIAESKGITNITVKNSEGKDNEFFYIKNIRGLMYCVQMNTLEFHIWGSKAENPDKPDIMIFDLDPDEGMDINKIRRGALDLKSVLDELKLKSFLKTSGGKGYHIAVPFKKSTDWEKFRAFSKEVAVLMEQKWPDRYTSNVRKIKRNGKIFIDWIRNVKGATSIAPYSIRAKEGAKVSMPIGWEELDKITPDGITMEEALKRLGCADPWEDFFK